MMTPLKRIVAISLASILCGTAVPVLAQVDTAANSSKAHLDLAVSYFQSKQYEVAQSEAEKSLQSDSKNSQALMLLGLVHMELKENEKAEGYFKSAISANPNNGDAYNNYGLLLCKTSRIDASLEQFAKALATPRYARTPQTLVNAGLCLYQKQDYVAAEKYFLKALEQDPLMPGALFQLSRNYLKQNRVELAQARLDGLHRQVSPNSSSTYLQLQIAKARGDAQEAQRLGERIAKQFPNSLEAKRLSAGDNTY